MSRIQLHRALSSGIKLSKSTVFIFMSIRIGFCVLLVSFYTIVSSSGLSPDLQSMEQIRRIMRPTDVPDTGLLSFSMCLCHWTKKRPDLEAYRNNAISFGNKNQSIISPDQNGYSWWFRLISMYLFFSVWLNCLFLWLFFALLCDRLAVWPAVVRPRQRCPGLGGERSRSFFYLWGRRRQQVSKPSRPGPHLPSTPGNTCSVNMGHMKDYF